MQLNFVFCPHFSSVPLPQVTDEDLYDDKKISKQANPPRLQARPPSQTCLFFEGIIPPPFSYAPTKHITFDLPIMTESEISSTQRLTTSFSTDCFQNLYSENQRFDGDDEFFMPSEEIRAIPRSFTTTFEDCIDFQSY